MSGCSPAQRSSVGTPLFHPTIAETQKAAVQRVARFTEAYNESAEASRAVLPELFGSVGQDVHVRAPAYVDYGTKIHIGARTFINMGLTALDAPRSSRSTRWAPR